MIKTLKENNQPEFDMKLMHIDCVMGRPVIIPLKDEEINIIKQWEGFSHRYVFHYDYKGHLIILIK